MPLLPPVTTATLPLSFAMFFSLVFGQSINGIGFWTYRFRCVIFERNAIFLTVRSTITPKGGLWIQRTKKLSFGGKGVYEVTAHAREARAFLELGNSVRE